MQKDHLGNIYPNRETMCKNYGISVDTYKSRIRKGWSLEKALTTPVGQTLSEKRPYNQVHAKDHLGNIYLSKKDMVKAYNLSLTTYNSRIKSGWTVEKALTTPTRNAGFEPESRTDMNGVVYASVNEMCKIYDIDPKTYTARIRNGWDKETALTTPAESIPVQTDHLGNTFPSEREMCHFHSINIDLYRKRIKAGLSLKDALTKPAEYKNSQTDPFGNSFESIQAICDHYHVSRDIYKNGMKSGRYTQAELLNILPKLNMSTKNVMIGGGLIVLSQISKLYHQHFLCQMDNYEIIMTKEQIVEHGLTFLRQQMQMSA